MDEPDERARIVRAHGNAMQPRLATDATRSPMRAVTALITCLLAITTYHAARAANAQTQVLSEQDLLKPSPDTSNTAYVWAAEIADNNDFYAKELKDPPAQGDNAPFRAESAVFTDRGRTIFASVALSSRTCESAGNGTGSTNVNPCATKVAVLKDGTITTVPSDRGCYIFEPNPTNSTSATFDPTTSTLSFSTVSGGVVVPDCSVSVQIP